MIYSAVQKLIDYAVKNELITNDDVYVVRNQLMEALKLTDWEDNNAVYCGENIDDIIVTTEKDAARLSCCPYFPHYLKSRTFYLPISVHMINRPEEGDFMQMLKKSIDATEL